MTKTYRNLNLIILGLLFHCTLLITSSNATDTKQIQSGDIDASDPTRIYTWLGGGYKYTEYANNEEIGELRLTANIGLSANDMVLIESGVGNLSGHETDNKGLTDSKVKWYHLMDMDYEKEWGFRGWGTHLEIKVGGGLRGTNVGNSIIAGAASAHALGWNWALYLSLIHI